MFEKPFTVSYLEIFGHGEAPRFAVCKSRALLVGERAFVRATGAELTESTH